MLGVETWWSGIYLYSVEMIVVMIVDGVYSVVMGMVIIVI